MRSFEITERDAHPTSVVGISFGFYQVASATFEQAPEFGIRAFFVQRLG